MKIRFLIIGIIQGIILCLLHNYAKNIDLLDNLPVWWLPCAMLAVFLPIMVYTTELIDGLNGTRRWGLIALISLVLLGISIYQAIISYRGQGQFAFFFSGTIWVFVVTHLGAGILARNQGGLFSDRRYHLMFEMVWRNGVMLGLACGVLGLFYGVLVSIGELFETIGIDFVKRAFREPIITDPLLTVAGAMIAAYAVQQRKTTTAIRNLALTATQWLLPIVVAFSALWLIALLLDFKTQFLNGSKGYILLWICALSVQFLNSAYQDGINRKPFPNWLMRATGYLWPVIAGMALLALYAMLVRVDGHGWSVDRVWGMLVAVMALIYTLGYSASALPKQRWMWSVGQTNIIGALCLAVFIPTLLSPIAYPQKLEIHSQFNRLTQQRITPYGFAFERYLDETQNYAYFGKPILETLKAGIEHPQKQEIIRLANTALRGTHDTRPTPTVLAKVLTVIPATISPDEREKFATASLKHSEYGARKCIQFNDCVVIWQDVAPNRGDEAILVQPSHSNCVDVYGTAEQQIFGVTGLIDNSDVHDTTDQQRYQFIGSLCAKGVSQHTQAVFKSLKDEANITINTKPNLWKTLEINGLDFEK